MKLLLMSIFALAHLYLGSAELFSLEEFNAAVQDNYFWKPDGNIYLLLVKYTKDFTREELAMFLAQLIRESLGFQFTEELYCQKGECADKYLDNVGLPGKSYHGRGYIQLKWGQNYKDASQALFGDDRLLKKPDQISKNMVINCLVSVWFWKNRVRPNITDKEGNYLLGASSKAFNKGVECEKDKEHSPAIYRWDIYVKVAYALKIKNLAKEKGCYN